MGRKNNSSNSSKNNAKNRQRAEELMAKFEAIKPQYSKIAVLSDIHANLQATLEVVQRSTAEHPGLTVCLGDVVGYGANPRECVDLVKALGYKTILGNHDRAAAEMAESFAFNDMAMSAIEWTRGELLDAHKEFFQSLELTYETPGVLFVHSSPKDPNKMEYILRGDVRIFEYFDQRLCFVGHSHYPQSFLLDTNFEIFSHNESDIVIGKDILQTIVNIGSVGQPRDGDNRAAYAIVDLDNWPEIHVKINRAEYNIQEAANEILRQGMPQFFATRLVHGI